MKFKSFSFVYLNNQFDSWEPYGWRSWQVYNLRLIIYQEFNERLIKLELNTEKEGCMSYTAPEDAQRPRAVYDIRPDFRGI